MKIPNWKTVISACCAFVLVFVYLRDLSPDGKLAELNPDSLEYIEFATALTSGSFLERAALKGKTRGEIIRTPGFPLVLIAANAVAPQHLTKGVLVVHGLVAITTLCTLFALLSSFLSPAPIAVLYIVSMHSFSNYFFAALPEWVTVNIILVLCALLVGKAEGRRPVVSAALLTAFLTLLRPELIILLIIVPLFFIRKTKPEGGLLFKDAGKAFLLAAIPLVLWMSVNAVRLGVFSLAPLSGRSIFGIAAMLTDAPAAPGDTHNQREFFTSVTKNRNNARDEELLENAMLEPHVLFTRYQDNVWKVGERAAVERGLGGVELDELMGSYAKRALMSDPLRYIKLVLYGWLSLIWILPQFLIMLGLSLYSVTGRALVEVRTAALFAAVSQIVHVLTISAVQVMVPRYYYLFASSVNFLTLLFLVVAIRAIFVRVALRSTVK